MHLGFTTVSLYSQNAEVGLYASIARRADQLGFESMWAGHHIALPTALAPDYPYTATGIGPHRARMHRLDPWVLFAHLAAQTERLRFGSGIYLLPLVSPLVTARAVATADVLSNGRIIFGIGVGWNREEYAIVGEDFGSRGARTDEIIEILRRLWTEHLTSFDGEYYAFEEIGFEPKPVQRPHPPILYGGSSPVALRRAARLDGCYLPGTDLPETLRLIELARAARASTELASAPFDITVGAPNPLTRSTLELLEERGATRVLFDVAASPLADDATPLPHTEEALHANLEAVGDALLGSFSS
jgi:probable F420-dependent oxidoreductase